MDAKKIIIAAMELPEFAKLEFIRLSQKESGYTPLVFYQLFKKYLSEYIVEGVRARECYLKFYPQLRPSDFNVCVSFEFGVSFLYNDLLKLDLLIDECIIEASQPTQVTTDPDKVTSEPDKVQQVRTILQPLFNDCGPVQFDSLIEHITAKNRPAYIPVIRFSGTKTAIYKKLGAVLKLGYDRKHLACVFSELCAMDYDVLYKKIGN